MKKLLTLFLLTLLSVTQVQGQAMYLKFWGTGTFDSPNHDGKALGEQLPSSGGNTWTYSIHGIQFDTWGTVNNGKVYFVPYIDWQTAGWGRPGSYKEYSSSGAKYTFTKNSSGDAGIALPDGYQNRIFTFYLDNLQDNSVDVTVTWTEDIKLKSTIDNFAGTSFSSYSNGEYTWTWTESQLENLSNGDELKFYLYDNAASKNYGPWGGDYTWGSTSSIEGTEIHVKSASAPYIYYWYNGSNTSWPGIQMSETDYDGNYKQSLSNTGISFILHNNGGSDSDKTPDITNVSGKVFYDYNGSNSATNCGFIDSDWYRKCLEKNTPNKFVITYAKGTTYTIKAKKEDGYWDVKVIEEYSPKIQLKSSLDSWRGTEYESENNGEYTWSLSKAQLKNLAEGTRISFKLYDDNINTWYGPKTADYDMAQLSEDYSGTTVHVKTTDTNTNAPYIYAYFTDNNKLSGDWPGTQMTEKDAMGNWVMHFNDKYFHLIISRNGENQSATFNNVYDDVYFTYNQSESPKAVQSISETDYENGWYKETANDNYNFYIDYHKGNTYIIKAKKNGSQWSVKIITREQDHDYYWVSPEVTNNQKWEYFKLVASRNRSGEYGDGRVSDKYFSFTIKDDDLKKWDGSAWQPGDDVRWYVVRDDDAMWYRPANNEEIGDASSRIYKGPNNNAEDFYYTNFTDCGTTTNRDTYISFKKGDYRSYTFILNAKPTNGSGNLYVNSPIPSVAQSCEAGDFYLIGNFKSASEAESITINTDRPMTKIWYKGGEPYNSSVESPDSVVFERTVSKPGGGWGNLYLDVNPSGNGGWDGVYRPLISLYNNLDGRALVGGLTKCGYGNSEDVHGDQSLNPEPSEFYSGYTFRFNATTMTYNLQFHSSLYLVGDAVTADGKGGSWDLDGTTNQTAHLIPLKATQETNHFRNKVTFKNGKGFRFLVKEDENTDAPYNRNWGEDANAPRFTSLAENEAHYAGTDTQYKNYLKYNTGNTSKIDPAFDGSSNIIFDLPDGEYTINFFNYGENSYYTIEREAELRDMNDVVYKGTKRTILGRGGYNFFRVWSDYIAWNKPEDVDVYVVTNFSPSGGTNADFDWHAASITLTKQNINYIPANTGVILAMKTDKNSLKGGMNYVEVKEADKATNTGYNNAWMQMTPYTEPGATVGDKGVLIPLYQATNLQRYEGEGSEEKANYLFGFYRANRVIANYTGAQEDFLLGFWQTTGVGNTYPNSAFLQLTRAQSDALGVGASYTVSEGGSGAPAFMLLFDDSGSDTVTGITDVNVQTPAQQLTNDHWYTLEGVRISAPTTKGIYIHGGKKVIVR